MDYHTAQIALAAAVAEDPFNMEHFRKFGFWAKIAVKAAEKGQAVFVKKAYIEILALEEKIDVFADVTGVMPALFFAAQDACKSTR